MMTFGNTFSDDPKPKLYKTLDPNAKLYKLRFLDPEALAVHRLRTMSDEKLQRRIRMIKRIDKMEDFIQVWLTDSRLHSDVTIEWRKSVQTRLKKAWFWL